MGFDRGAGMVPATPWWLKAGVASVATLASRGGRRLSILIFHRVTPEPDPLFPGEMHAARFDAVLATLAAAFHVLPLAEAIARLERSALPPRAVSITFDDGYADNYEIALPALLKHGLHSTFFIATGFLDGGTMWNDQVIDAIRCCPEPELDLGWLGLGTCAVGAASAKRSTIDRVLGKLKYVPLEERSERVARLRESTVPAKPPRQMLTSAEVRALHDAGMEIGGHTRDHPILAVLPPDAAARQIGEDRERLTGILGAPPALFAYPNGKPREDYTRANVEMVRRAGYQAAVTTARGSADVGSDRYQLPRFTPWDVDLRRFALRMAGNFAARPAAVA